jgi:sRNA-binding carbon storage regulator CsrA
MLVLTQNKDEEIVIQNANGEIIIRKGEDYGRIAIEAPKEYSIFRRENSKKTI